MWGFFFARHPDSPCGTSHCLVPQGLRHGANPLPQGQTESKYAMREIEGIGYAAPNFDII